MLGEISQRIERGKEEVLVGKESLSSSHISVKMAK
jgi:hypothetical protein